MYNYKKEKRDVAMPIRLTKTELALIDDLCVTNKQSSWQTRMSRADLIVKACMLLKADNIAKKENQHSLDLTKKND